MSDCTDNKIWEKAYFMLTRILTAVIGIAIGIVILLFADTFLLGASVAALSVMIVFEVLSNCKFLEYKIHSAVCFVFSAALPFLTQYCSKDIIYIFASVCIFIMMTAFVMSNKKIKFDHLCVMITVTLLSSMAMCCLIKLKELDEIHGTIYIVICLAAAWLSDGVAYFVGTFFGKHKLCPEISPKKTVEGAVGGVIGGAIVLVIFAVVYHAIRTAGGLVFDVNYVLLAICGLISGVLAIIGDLTASLLKRQHNIKDFGKIMPGHGGVLDRFDSVLFVAPFLALVFEYVKLFN